MAMRTAVLLLAAAAPAAAARPAAGSHAVTQETFVDDGLEPLSGVDTRKVRVTYPSDATAEQQFPLVVYAHGAAGGGIDETAYDKHFKDIAAYGFVVIAPMSCFMGCPGAAGSNATVGSEGNGICYKKWPSFTYESTRAVTYAKNASASGAAWASHIDWAAGIGAAGHSMGGEPAVGMASAAVAKEFGVKAMACEHCLACINTGDLVTVPAIYFTGTDDFTVTPKRVKNAYAADTVTPKTYRNQKGKGHLEMLNLEVQYNPAIASHVAAFMKVYLNGDKGTFYDQVYGTGPDSVCGYATMKECEHVMQ